MKIFSKFWSKLWRYPRAEERKDYSRLFIGHGGIGLKKKYLLQAWKNAREKMRRFEERRKH